MNSEINVDYSRPIIPKDSHPIDTGRYLLPTNEIDRLYKKVSQCINNRFPGAIIYGRPRLGKTRALIYLMHLLPEKFQKIPIYFITCREHKNPLENTFFGELLNDVGHAAPFTGKPDVKRDRLLKFLLENANASRQHRTIFLVDDAQNLHEIQYGWLMNIYNELDKHGVSLTVFLIGQNELLNQRSIFLELGKHQIIGRFMVSQYQFSGIKTVEDMRECLNSYDENCEYPVGSNFSFTQYFFPHVFHEGFRLSNNAETLFYLFETLRKEAGLSGELEIPMQYLTLSIEYALKNYGIEGACLSGITKSQWIEAIENSGYIDAEIYASI